MLSPVKAGVRQCQTHGGPLAVELDWRVNFLRLNQKSRPGAAHMLSPHMTNLEEEPLTESIAPSKGRRSFRRVTI